MLMERVTRDSRTDEAPGVRPLHLLLFLVTAIALRIATFGDPNLHVDESFYQTVGIAMHEGAIPYVDVWDRKPWGLFFLYYLIAFISYSPIAYQVIATIFAAATAWVIARLASAWSTTRAGLLAGMAYLLWLTELQGFGGQTPIFYNLFIATAALLVFSARDRLLRGQAPPSVAAAMALAGVAITIKQTAVFEASFLGLYASARLFRSPMPRSLAWRPVLLWAAIGAAPTLTIAGWYAAEGYWGIYWHAMYTASANRPMFLYPTTMRFLITFVILAPLLVVATLSLADWKGESRRFVTGWIAAAVIGLVFVPNFYMHYSLPLLVPLSAATAVFLARPVVGQIAMAGLAAYSVCTFDPLDARRTQQSIDAFAELADVIRAHDDGSPLFVVDGPPQLYTLTGHAFPTPLVFPHHLGDANEKDLSHLSTLGETRRVLAQRPGIVVTPDKPREGPPNMEVLDTVYAYVRKNCRRVANIETPDALATARMDVWADCRKR